MTNEWLVPKASASNTPVTLAQALEVAAAYWASKGPSSRMMPIRARHCARLIPLALGEVMRLSDLTPAHGTHILTKLQREGKSKASVQSYYAAFRRAIALGGGDTRGWPSPATPERRVREPLKDASLVGLREAFEKPRWKRGGRLSPYQHRETIDLLILLNGTGMRVDVEALSWDAWTWDPERKVLKIKGKGGHERQVPVEEPECVELLGSPVRLAAMRRLSYAAHLKRWNDAVKSAGIKSKLPTPHAVRHAWATRAYHKSGKDLVLVKELLGHADVATTARYIGVDVEEMRNAVRA